MEDRRWSMGIHEAVEVKENMAIEEEQNKKFNYLSKFFYPIS